MNISIKSYDIPYASIEFTEQRSTGYVQASEKKIECKLHIKGSQENRPKILLGDVVRLRALPGSCVEGILPDKFEIQGVVKSFRLATEEAVVEFADMPTSYAYVITNTNPLLELNARKYQVRFTFDRCGFGFIQESLQIISAAYNKHLITMLFPNDNMLSPVQLSPTRVNHTFGAGTVPLNGQQMAVVQYLADCATSMKQHYDNPSLYSAHVRPPYVIFGPPGILNSTYYFICILFLPLGLMRCRDWQNGHCCGINSTGHRSVPQS